MTELHAATAASSVLGCKPQQLGLAGLANCRRSKRRTGRCSPVGVPVCVLELPSNPPPPPSRYKQLESARERLQQQRIGLFQAHDLDAQFDLGTSGSLPIKEQQAVPSTSRQHARGGDPRFDFGSDVIASKHAVCSASRQQQTSVIDPHLDVEPRATPTKHQAVPTYTRKHQSVVIDPRFDFGSDVTSTKKQPAPSTSHEHTVDLQFDLGSSLSKTASAKKHAIPVSTRKQAPAAPALSSNRTATKRLPPPCPARKQAPASQPHVDAALSLSSTKQPTPAPPSSRKPAKPHDIKDRDIKDPCKKWGLTVDWKLMGAENVSIDDALFETLVEQCALERRWRPMVAYLASLGLTEKEFLRLADKRIECFAGSVSRARSRLNYLTQTVGVPEADLPKIIVRHPQVLEYRIERTMAPHVQYLLSIGVSKEDLGKTISRAPVLLELSIEKSLQPRVQYLIEHLGVSHRDVGKVVARSPQVLTQSMDTTQTAVGFLSDIGISHHGIARMVTKHPQVLRYSVEEGLKPRLEFLQSIGMDEEDIVLTVSRLGQIFGLSVENALRPKFHYLTSELHGTVRTVVQYPAYFSLSLAQRIMPRHQFLLAINRSPPRGTAFPMKHLAVNDGDFAQKVAGVSLGEYERFRQELLLCDFAQQFAARHNVR
eukprot:jgi/Chlat1/5528/Chrsp369S00407